MHNNEEFFICIGLILGYRLFLGIEVAFPHYDNVFTSLKKRGNIDTCSCPVVTRPFRFPGKLCSSLKLYQPWFRRWQAALQINCHPKKPWQVNIFLVFFLSLKIIVVQSLLDLLTCVVCKRSQNDESIIIIIQKLQY